MTLYKKIEKYSFILLMSIVLLGGFLRFYQLDTNPPALNWDEVAFGYNAYSILETGRDEYGAFLPVYLRSLDDYKRPVYTYATVGSVALFGLNSFAVRLPAALFGTLTILVVYLIALELCKKREVALLSALLLAITPWHIQFSHAGFEASMGFFFTGLGVLFVLHGMRKYLWYLPLASLAFGLAMYSYLGQRVAVPLLLLMFFCMYGKKLWYYLRNPKKKQLVPLIIAVGVLIFFFAALFMDASRPEGNIRYKATSIFSQTAEYEPALHRMQVDAKEKINLPRRIFHDERAFTSLELVMRGYLTHFSPDFFFFDLGQQHHQTPGIGILYIWMLPFMLIGFYALYKHEQRETIIIMTAWILGPPVAAAVTYQIPHALRVGDMILPLMMLIALGIYTFFVWLQKTRKFLVIPGIIALTIIGSVYTFYFFHQYTIHLPEERSKDWVYGRKEAVAYTEKVKANYKKVLVSTNLEYPYIFFLYYTAYDPKKYQLQGGTKSGGFAETENAFDKYEFHTFDYANAPKEGNYLYVGLPSDFPAGVTPLKKINYLNGTEAIYIVESKGKK